MTNDSPRAQEALHRWREDVGKNLPPTSKPSPGVAVRLALVHEFKTRSRVFISTEAGAKGLNLQFCDTVINYDLPWNPQRIEQRIGRCHRYGQERDVTVINFLAKDNGAQRLTLEILTQKLDLFGNVLDMSDDILHAARSDRSEELTTALGPDFEKQLHRIWDRARSVDDVEEELRWLARVYRRPSPGTDADSRSAQRGLSRAASTTACSRSFARLQTSSQPRWRS